MATKSIVVDELERAFLVSALESFEAVLKRKLNSEQNPDVKVIRSKELSAVQSVKGKVLS